MLVFVKKYQYYKNSTTINKYTSILLHIKNKNLYINIIYKKYIHQKTFIIFENNCIQIGVILTFIIYEIYTAYFTYCIFTAYYGI